MMMMMRDDKLLSIDKYYFRTKDNFIKYVDRS